MSVYRGDGKGGFLPKPISPIAAGADPTGLTVADINGDGKLDLLVGNAYGDLLVLLGNGDGTFQPVPERRPAAWRWPSADLTGNGTAGFHLRRPGARSGHRPDYGGGTVDASSATRSSGPARPRRGRPGRPERRRHPRPDRRQQRQQQRARLSRPGRRPVRPGAQRRPRLLHRHRPGRASPSPTSHGRPDLVVANKGSNDVSILLNVPTADGGFTFVPGPRLK